MQSPDVQPPQPPQTLPGTPQAQLPDGQIIGLPQGSPGEVYQGAVARRDALRETREGIQEQRNEISGQLQDPMVNGANRAGLEARISQLDQRLIQLDQQITQAETQVAQAAAVPGATHMPDNPMEFHPGPPNIAFVIPVVFIVFVLGPLSVAAAIRILRRGGKAAVAAVTPQWMQERFGRLEQSVDTMAMEVERISEGQRFLTRIFSENGNRALGQGAAQPIELGARESAGAQSSSSTTSRGPVR